MTKSCKTYLGVIGGSGLYDLPGLMNIKEERVETPFGMPSDNIVTGESKGKRVAFLPRHGKGHRFTPSEVNYKANIFALKKLGVNQIVSVSAVGSLQDQYAPGSIVIPAQILDRTNGSRKRTFFGEGLVGHVSFADPYCPFLRGALKQACDLEGNRAFSSGTYVCIEGPRFSSRAESNSYRSHGADIIGMTAMPEAILAREAEIPYATLAFVTDYDCWKEHEAAVTVEAVMLVLKQNSELSKKIIKNILDALPLEIDSLIFNAAQFALMTPENLIPVETKRKIELLYGKYWNKSK